MSCNLYWGVGVSLVCVWCLVERVQLSQKDQSSAPAPLPLTNRRGEIERERERGQKEKWVIGDAHKPHSDMRYEFFIYNIHNSNICTAKLSVRIILLTKREKSLDCTVSWRRCSYSNHGYVVLSNHGSTAVAKGHWSVLSLTEVIPSCNAVNNWAHISGRQTQGLTHHWLKNFFLNFFLKIGYVTHKWP
jgi:hypothetical protein